MGKIVGAFGIPHNPHFPTWVQQGSPLAAEIVRMYQPLADAFEKKYGVRVDLWRALSDKVVQRVVTEARGRRHSVDVVETNGPEMEMLARERLLAAFDSPHIADLPPAAIPAHRTWMPDRMNYFVVGYNTQKVKRSEILPTYEGFLDPRWKGRIGIEATDVEWMATLVKTRKIPATVSTTSATPATS